jgi:hypothetical protein
MNIWVSAEGVARVVRNIEPLVAVTTPRIGTLEPVHEMSQRRTRRGPQAESTVDVEPGAHASSLVGNPREVIERASVDVAGLGNDDRRGVRLQVEDASQQGRIHRAIRAGRHHHDRLLTDPQQPQRSVDGGVAFLTNHDSDTRRSEQPFGADIPAATPQDLPAPSGQSDGVGRLCPRHEPGRRRHRKTQQLLQPRTGDILERQRRGRQRLVERDLIPPAGKHVRRQRGLERTAHHETEIARSR